MAVEIVWTRLAYSDSYLVGLRKMFEGVVPSSADAHRLILGTYSESGDIHKRPLSALMQNIGKLLGLIE